MNCYAHGSFPDEGSCPVCTRDQNMKCRKPKPIAWLIKKQTGISEEFLAFEEPCTCGCTEYEEIYADDPRYKFELHFTMYPK